MADYECDIDTSVSQLRKFLDRCIVKRTDHSVIADIGTRTIDGERLRFFLEVERKGNIFRVSIPIPEGYPDTEVLRDKKVIENDSLFKASISTDKVSDILDRGFGKIYKEADRKFHTTGRKLLILHSFYLYPKRNRNLQLTASESRVFSGLGKKTLCLALMIIRSEFDVRFKPSQTLMMLEASGGDIQTREDEDRVKQLMKQGMSEDDAEEMVRLENNDKLISYYHRAFGFERLNDVRKNGDSMAARVSTVLQYCGYSQLKI